MKTFKFGGREHKVFRISAFGSEHEVILTKEEYYNPKTLAVQAYEVYDNGEAEPFGMLTANMAPSDDAYEIGAGKLTIIVGCKRPHSLP